MEPNSPGRSLLQRWGMGVARRRYRVLVLWLLLLVLAGVLYPLLQSRLGAPDYSVARSESARAQKLLEERFPEIGAEQDVVVFRSARVGVDAPEYRGLVERVLRAVRTQRGVTGAYSPYDAGGEDQVARDRRVAVAVLGLAGDEASRARLAASLRDVIRREAAGGGVEVYLTGPSPLTNDLSDVELDDQQIAESIGIPVALLVLLLAFGALVAAALPIAVALASLLVSMGLLVPLADPLHLDRFVTVVATVIGIGVGIDYALFVVSRFREELARRVPGGHDRADRRVVAEAIGVAVRTAGRTVVTSGLVVIVALGTLILIDGHIFMEIAVAAGLVVACALFSSLTLLPALLAVLGDRVNNGALPALLRPAHVAPGGAAATGRWAGWARFVLRRPVLLGLPAFLLLAALALPTASIRLGIDWGLGALGDTPSGKGQRIVTASFGPGTVGPIQVLACARPAPLDAPALDGVARLTRSLRADRRVAAVTSVTNVLDQQAGGHGVADLRRAAASPRLRPVLGRLVDLGRGGGCTYLTVVPATAIDAPAASELVTDLRTKTVPAAFGGSGVRVQVGGITAQHVDLSAETAGKLPLVIAIVLVLSFGYLLVVFRSLLLPLKAAVLNLLSTAAALGVTVLVFQEGHGQGVLGFTSVGTLQAYLPVALFAMLFGLSMDYEIFLVGRMQEEWQRSGDNARAVADGLDHTARQITAGAAIMVAVFGSLMVARVLELKQFGFALAFAVLLDATIVRMLLVPAAMGIASRANWWLPSWLDRLLPAMRAHSAAHPPDPSPERMEDARYP